MEEFNEELVCTLAPDEMYSRLKDVLRFIRNIDGFK